MTFSQMKPITDEPKKHYYEFITYRDNDSPGVSKSTDSWRSLLERGPHKYMSFYLEFIYE